MKKHNTRTIRKSKISQTNKTLQMLTCYDYQTAKLLSETELDIILVGDSLGNVMLGHDSTVKVTLEEMTIFASAVKRGAKEKFVVADLPFGSIATFDRGIENSIKLFQQSGVEALKLEGASTHHLALIQRLTEAGIPIMGHIGLMPQSVHQQGGYYTHGKDDSSRERLLKEAHALCEAGVFSLVLECIQPQIAKQITEELPIPTIGIGSGKETDGQVLVINDLLKLGSDYPPSFCEPIADLYAEKKRLIESYLQSSK